MQGQEEKLWQYMDIIGHQTKEQHLDRGINEITEFCKDNHYKHGKNIYRINRQEKNFSRPRYNGTKG